MSENNTLSLSAKYPVDKYNVLVPIQTVTEIADIQKPVMNVVNISTNLDDKEIYIQDKGKEAQGRYPARPTLYALTRKGLLKLMRAAGIKMVSSKSVLPSTCQKCAEVNKSIGRPVNCGNCSNKDVKYTVTISAPQLTGEDILYECSREIIVDDETNGMTEAQRQQFMKFRAEHCESKALNRALRAAMLIKPTYTLDELKKPFVVAYLTPNLNNPEVKQKAVDSFFSNASAVYGGVAQVEQSRKITIDDDDEAPSAPQADFDPIPAEFANDDPAPDDFPPDMMPEEFAEPDPFTCSDCGRQIEASGSWTPEKIVDFSKRAFGRSLCPACQRKLKQSGQRR